MQYTVATVSAVWIRVRNQKDREKILTRLRTLEDCVGSVGQLVLGLQDEDSQAVPAWFVPVFFRPGYLVLESVNRVKLALANEIDLPEFHVQFYEQRFATRTGVQP